MKNFFLSILLGAFIIPMSLFAQINDSGMHSKMLITTKNSNALNEIQGSHFLDENFKSGKVLIEGKDLVNGFLRYNVNTETFEIKMKETSEEVYVLPLHAETIYYMDSVPYSYQTINVNGKSITGYFISHYDGEKVSLLEKPYLTIMEAVKAKTGYEKDKPAQIRLQNDYYIVLRDGSVENVKLKEKDFEKALPSSRAVKKYLSDNKLKTVEDFTQMLAWYDKQVE